MSYSVRMARTFVRVELIRSSSAAESPFSKLMEDLGFHRTITGRKTRKPLLLPSGMYLIDRIEPAEALDLTRQAVRTANVEARIFCMPVGGDVRFGNLRFDDATM
jgi:hypothetical protein